MPRNRTSRAVAAEDFPVRLPERKIIPECSDRASPGSLHLRDGPAAAFAALQLSKVVLLLHKRER